MPKLKDFDVTYDQIRDLVKQLDFEEKIALMRELINEKGYKKSLYAYTEGLAKKYNIPEMDEDELDMFLHEKGKGD